MTKNWVYIIGRIRTPLCTYEKFIQAKSTDSLKIKFCLWVDKVTREQNKKDKKEVKA